MELSDIYIYIEDYEDKDVSYFLNSYLENFKPTSDYYEYPYLSLEPTFECSSFKEMFNYILSLDDRDYMFYLKNRKNIEYKMGMIRFNSDNTLSLGLGVVPKFEQKYIDVLRKDFGTNKIFICYNVPPPSSGKEIYKILS